MALMWSNGLQNKIFMPNNPNPGEIKYNSTIHNHDDRNGTIRSPLFPSEADRNSAKEMKKRDPNISNYIYSPSGNGAGTIVKYNSNGIMKVNR